MSGFRLTLKAKEDLISIASYTQKLWGSTQRRSYLKRIDEAFFLLAEQPDLGVDCSYIRKDYRKFQIEAHFIFYKKATDNFIDVIRVLHKRRNIEFHL